MGSEYEVLGSDEISNQAPPSADKRQATLHKGPAYWSLWNWLPGADVTELVRSHALQRLT